MSEEQQKIAKTLLLNVLYGYMGGHINTGTEDGVKILDDIKEFVFTDLRLNV